MNWFLNAAREFHVRHERLKNYVHTAWRFPLPPWGRFLMGCFYFSIPVVGGWHVMQWAIGRAHDSIGERGEKLDVKTIQGIGDKRVLNGELQKVGAGGIGGGVKLAVSDSEVQQRNRKMLETYLKRERKRRRREAKEQQ